MPHLRYTSVDVAIELGVEVSEPTITMIVELASIVGAIDIVLLAKPAVKSGVVVDGASKSNDALVAWSAVVDVSVLLVRYGVVVATSDETVDVLVA